MMTNWNEFEKLNPGEQRLVEWQYNTASHFVTALFELLSRADRVNMQRIALGFPEEAQAFRKFKTVRGWWESVQRRIGAVA